MAATAVFPAWARRAPARPVVAVVGAGMAGVSTAWLLDGRCDVVLLERRDRIGGNVETVDVDLDGERFTVDLGAQFFHPGPYPVYTALLEKLGLFPPGGAAFPSAVSFPASITIEARGEATPRFVAPVTPTRTWPTSESWNVPGLLAFLATFTDARRREQHEESWSLTLGDWLPTLGLTRDQQEGIILPWAASLFSGDIDQTRGLSARSAMVFAAKALPDDLTEQVVYYVLSSGLIEPMRRMLGQCSTVEAVTDAAVAAIEPGTSRRFTVRCTNGRSFAADQVVFAASGPATQRLLEGIAGSEPEQAALRGIEFHRASLTLHTDPIYAPADPAHWSFLNCQLHRPGSCEASMWLAGVANAPAATAAKLWKSWTTHRSRKPTEVLHKAEFMHMLPTPASIDAQADVRRLQGRIGLWFAGGYLFPYDAQETALLSAMEVADGISGTSTAGRRMLPATL
jgi:predicted NAD/FAD-binding protein